MQLVLATGRVERPGPPGRGERARPVIRQPATRSRAGDGTRVDFVAEGSLRGLMRVAGPITRLVMDRQFAKYHENLRRNVESRS
jgi:hypothetical protein